MDISVFTPQRNLKRGCPLYIKEILTANQEMTSLKKFIKLENWNPFSLKIINKGKKIILLGAYIGIHRWILMILMGIFFNQLQYGKNVK